MTAQLQYGVERFRCRAVCEAGGQVVAPLLKLVQHVHQRLHRVSPPFRSTAPIGRPTVSDNHRLRRRSRGSSLAPRPVGRGSLGGGRGAIAAGWWSWHPGLISRDASRVQWRSTADRRRRKIRSVAPLCPACRAALAAGHHGCALTCQAPICRACSRHTAANGIA